MYTSFRTRLVIVATLAVPLCTHAQQTAATNTVTDTIPASGQRLNPVVVTAALAPQTADRSLSSVTVIDRATFQRQDPTSLTQLLRGQPGVNIASNGGPGTNTSLFLRGAPAAGSTLMIDGIRLRSATVGTPALQYLDPRMFDHAELVRGPRSSLYGADASGGVLQLFTPEDKRPGAHPRFSIGMGSHATRRGSASISGSESNTSYSFAASTLDSNGTKVRHHGNNLGYRNTSVLGKLKHQFDNGAEIGVTGLRAKGRNYNDYGDGYSDFIQQVAGIYGEVPITGNWHSRLTLSEARDKLNTHSSYGSVINTRTQTARWQNTVDFGPHQWITGAEYSEDRVSGTEDYDVSKRYNKAVFTQGLLDFDPLSVQASLRYDDNEAYGDNLTGGLALGFKLDDVHTLRASYGTAFRAPTFNDLYWPEAFNYRGNPDLKPEKSHTTEIGIRADHQQWYWDLALYQSDYRDLISTGPAPDDPNTSMPLNIDRARVRGAELSSGADMGRWHLRGALTLSNPKDRNSGKDLPRRAGQTARIDVDRDVAQAWTVGGSFNIEGKRYNDTGNQQRLGSFSTLDLRTGWRFAPQWQAHLALNNVLNKRYETITNYFEPRRTLMLDISYVPER